jgi:hypothetical protein
MKNGVLTLFVAGILGPEPTSLQNFTPWSIVVGAGTLDRKFVTKVKLGNNKIYEVNAFFCHIFRTSFYFVFSDLKIYIMLLFFINVRVSP